MSWLPALRSLLCQGASGLGTGGVGLQGGIEALMNLAGSGLQSGIFHGF